MCAERFRIDDWFVISRKNSLFLKRQFYCRTIVIDCPIADKRFMCAFEENVKLKHQHQQTADENDNIGMIMKLKKIMVLQCPGVLGGSAFQLDQSSWNESCDESSSLITLIGGHWPLNVDIGREHDFEYSFRLKIFVLLCGLIASSIFGLWFSFEMMCNFPK